MPSAAVSSSCAHSFDEFVAGDAEVFFEPGDCHAASGSEVSPEIPNERHH
jgi:hypothetical protein